MNIEIEHKYLIEMPSSELISSLQTSKIEQTYLQCEDGTERVRARTSIGQIGNGESSPTVYTHTHKRRIGKMSREEDERTITRAEYESFMSCPHDGETIVKTRSLLTFDGRTFEIDIYPFWKRIAVMELEVEDEDAQFELPPSVNVLCEVTSDRQFTNHALAHAIPDETILLKQLAHE